MNANPVDQTETGAVPKHKSWQSQIKIMVFLVSLAFSTVGFIAFDCFYSGAIQRTRASNHTNCRTRDPVRYSASKPNCASIEHWGKDAYEFHTNNLGFRDERIRDVPLTDARPRILILGDSFSEGLLAWRDSYVGRITALFPQYDVLNGSVPGYSPSNYLNTARMVLAQGVDIDEAVVFIGMADVHYEAGRYRDVDASGAVIGFEGGPGIISEYAKWRLRIARRLLVTNYLFEFFERVLVGRGYYHLPTEESSDMFDMESSAWTYRTVKTDPYPAGYGPLGLEGGIAKEKTKMTLLWQELEKRNIAISIVVYPYPAQILHDTADSRQVRIWREWCQGKCKRFISLFPAFLAVKNQCPHSQPGCWYLSFFIFGDYHYNAAGNALVADMVIESLTEEPPTKRQSGFSGRNSARDWGAH